MQNRQIDQNEKDLSTQNSDSSNQLNKWDALGSECFKPATKLSVRIKQFELPKGTLQYDKKRHMFFYGENLDNLISTSSSEPDHIIKDQEGNTSGIVFKLKKP